MYCKHYQNSRYENDGSKNYPGNELDSNRRCTDNSYSFYVLINNGDDNDYNMYKDTKIIRNEIIVIVKLPQLKLLPIMITIKN